MIRRLYVEKKEGCRTNANKIKNDIKEMLGIDLSEFREFIRYDIEGIKNADYELAKNTIFSELPIDTIYEEVLPNLENYKVTVIEYLAGQYDQRADSASQCVQLLTKLQKPLIKCAKVYAFIGANEQEFQSIKSFLINPVESREGSLDKPDTLQQTIIPPNKVEILENFINYSDEEIYEYHRTIGFAMSIADLIYVRDYFISTERPPTITELKVIDTYWSDHCRHTTFLTELIDIKISSNNPHIAKALKLYGDLFSEINGTRHDKYKCLMDIAVIAGKKLVRDGILDNMDISDEINACSIDVKVDNNGKEEDWLIMFKNETHNHPTEIEPFGGAATCLGGAIRDPLSGRVYVYQAMRVTGASDPRESFADTLKGKLPQSVLTKTATSGFSSYGNQIGLATGIVDEMYHSGYKAKRLETGFVIGAAPKKNVRREKPQAGDIVVLLGGATGRDGCGGATGSSKAHTIDSVEECGAEVQKGNPPVERKIQRLFRNPKASALIIKCNDFGAGGVCVAIGELADGIDIDLDEVPKKYEGLDGTELAISESQERMAVMLKPDKVEEFTAYASEENLNCTRVAKVTDEGRIRMYWGGNEIVNIRRDFLDTNGVKQIAKASINEKITNYINIPNAVISEYLEKNDYLEAIQAELKRINVTAKKGMSETFDSTIGASSVLLPWGGITQTTPAQAMAAKVPVSGETDTVTVCAYGCYPELNESSPFVGAIYSIISSISKVVASGVNYKTVRLTLQEFFKKLGQDATRWGEPLSALLGALYAQMNLGIGAIGGKDSMSGTFEDIDVPPTLISFAVGLGKASEIITNVYSEEGTLYLIKLDRDNNSIPNFEYVLKVWNYLYAHRKEIMATSVVEEGGAIISIIKSALGNSMGVQFESCESDLWQPRFGDIVIQTKTKPQGIECTRIGKVNNTGTVSINNELVATDSLAVEYLSTLSKIFPITACASGEANYKPYKCLTRKASSIKIAKPKVFIPVFPGTNCEYDTARAFEKAGAETEMFVIRNQSATDIAESVSQMARLIKNSQIVAFPGGFSGGDEPDGSGKFISTTFRNPVIAEAIMDLLNNRDGLALGICNGFQALIKLGLVPYGKIIEQNNSSSTLTYNNISRHVSTISRVIVSSNSSPWLSECNVGDVYSVAISHGEGRFIAPAEEIQRLVQAGQVATQYVDLEDKVTMKSPYNPNGSMNAIEGILSPDGRVFGKMGHIERIGKNLYRNYIDEFDMKVFQSGINYFK